jgi:putative glutamine amidotransferase
MKPRIGIPVPTTIDLPYNQRSWPSYAGGVARSGGEPVELDLALSAGDLKSLAATCDGFLLPGSPADVDPELFDTPRIPACGPADVPRQQADFLLLEYAAASGKPVLGICYGCQSMNVFHGGSLIQDLSPLPVNHEAGSKVAIAHSALIARDSLLGSILLADPEAAVEAAPPPGSATPEACLRLPVNTSHHQSVAVCGKGLRIVARCPDDEVVEAIELASPRESGLPEPTLPEPSLPETSLPESGLPDTVPRESTMFHVEHPRRRFLLGVQWHPERSLEISPASRAIFHALIAAAQSAT